jgi:hypothetical protein
MLSNVFWSLVIVANVYVVFRGLSKLGKKKPERFWFDERDWYDNN